MKILHRDSVKKIVENTSSGTKCVLKGASGTGKTSLLMERCILLSEKHGSMAASILVLVSDSIQLDRWNSEMAERIPAAYRILTFSDFIKEELTLYYPLALANCSEIVQKEIKPVFLSPEASVHLISKVIQNRREKDGLFGSLVSSNERLAAVLAGNLKAAALEGIPAEEIGCTLYEALDRKDTEKERIFCDMNEICLAYRRKCLELGILDYGMSVEIFRKYILPDENYRKALVKRFRHLIADDLQEASYAMLELTEILRDSCETAFFAYDPEFGSAELLHDNGSILAGKVCKACEIVELEYEGKSDFAEALYSAIINNEAGAVGCGVNIERYPALELRSEMLEQLAYKVCSLIKDEGLNPSDIAILSTYGDIVTELVIGNILKQRGITLFSTASRQNAADSPLCSGLLAFTRLCHPDLRMFPERDAVFKMTRLLFGIDPARSSKIARKTCSTIPFPELPGLVQTLGDNSVAIHINEKYEYVRNWINVYKAKGKPESISAFLQLALMEIFLDEAVPQEEVFKAKQLVDTAEKFTRAASKFGRNTARDFIEMAESILKAHDVRLQAGASVTGSVLLTTPEAYIGSPVNNKVLIISGLSSNHWSKGRGQELSNPRVLSASWSRGMKYTSEMEEKDSRRYLAAMLRAVLKKGSSRVIAFESLLSENGSENSGILPDILSTCENISPSTGF